MRDPIKQQAIEVLAADQWTRFTEGERKLTRFGMFPSWSGKELTSRLAEQGFEADVEAHREHAVALMRRNVGEG